MQAVAQAFIYKQEKNLRFYHLKDSIHTNWKIIILWMSGSFNLILLIFLFEEFIWELIEEHIMFENSLLDVFEETETKQGHSYMPIVNNITKTLTRNFKDDNLLYRPVSCHSS